MGGGALHNNAKRLRAIGQYHPDENLLTMAVDILRRVQSIRKLTGVGTYVLADSSGYVYVLKAESVVAERMVNKLSAMLVGTYAVWHSPLPTAEHICEDLRAHWEALELFRKLPTIGGT
jgi:hypothetical protein